MNAPVMVELKGETDPLRIAQMELQCVGCFGLLRGDRGLACH
jgi:hypothetical protein